MPRLQQISLEYGLRINRAKTKVMIIDRTNNNQPHVRQIAGYEVVDSFVYLGSLITNTGEEIRRRIAMAKSAITKLTKFWRDLSGSNAMKVRLPKSLTFRLLLVPAKPKRRRTPIERGSKASKCGCVWVYRRILRVSWTEHRTNQSILDELRIKDRLLATINKARAGFTTRQTRQLPRGRRRLGAAFWAVVNRTYKRLDNFLR